MKDLALEIGVEELPAGVVSPALAQVKQLLAEQLRQENIRHGEIRTYGTPRRLVALVSGVAPRQPDTVIEVRGPAARQAFDAEGNYTSAAFGFSRSQGVFPEDLKVKRVTGGEYLFVERPNPGLPTVEVAARFLPGIITSLTFPKTMRWGEDALRFSRPIRWILALYGEEIIPFRLGGVESGRMTRGHRVLWAPPAQQELCPPAGAAQPAQRELRPPAGAAQPAQQELRPPAGAAQPAQQELRPPAGAAGIEMPDASAYLDVVRAGHVVVDPEERRKAILEQVGALAEAEGAEPLADGLVDEIVFMVEHPTAFAGAFDPAFLALPREALTLVMRKQQRYFPLAGPEGNLLPRFIGVRDGGSEGIETVRAGNERVLRARFTDIRFFYEEDLRVPLPERVERLRGILYQERLGSLYEKAERLVSLTGNLCDLWGADDALCRTALRAALLAKADLASAMMKELPELQGTIGRAYARHAGEPSDVADAIADHYRPRAAGDALPQTEAGRLVGVADRIDTLVGYFGIGLVPTGSQDPFALRRQAVGLVAILADSPPLSLGHLVETTYARYGDRGPGWRSLDVTRASLLDFLRLRLESILAERGVRYDTVDAVLDAGFDDVPGAIARALILEEKRDTPEFAETLTAAVRIGSLLRFAARSEMAVAPGEVRIDLLQEEAEQAFYGAYLDVRPRVMEAAARGDYAGAFDALGGLAETANEFFDNVLVMSDDETLRANRLRLLGEIHALFLQVADLTRLVVESE